uniref:Uncharacterized protein n=1 Tax=Arundo donax TaxID=35708 RepID=A0A0A8Z9L6_ARUDO
MAMKSEHNQTLIQTDYFCCILSANQQGLSQHSRKLFSDVFMVEQWATKIH